MKDDIIQDIQHYHDNIRQMLLELHTYLEGVDEVSDVVWDKIDAQISLILYELSKANDETRFL